MTILNWSGRCVRCPLPRPLTESKIEVNLRIYSALLLKLGSEEKEGVTFLSSAIEGGRRQNLALDPVTCARQHLEKEMLPFRLRLERFLRRATHYLDLVKLLDPNRHQRP